MMRRLPALLAAAAFACIVPAAGYSPLPLSTAIAGTLGSAWVLALIWRPHHPAHLGALIATAGLCAAIAVDGGSVSRWLSAAGLSLALSSWDASHVARFVRGYRQAPPGAFQRRYLLTTLCIVGLCVAGAEIAARVSLSLTFPGAFGLSLLMLMLVTGLLFLARKTQRAIADETPQEDEADRPQRPSASIDA